MNMLLSVPDLAVSFICGSIVAVVIILVSPKGADVPVVVIESEDVDNSEKSAQRPKEEIQRVLNQSPHLKKFFGVDSIAPIIETVAGSSSNASEAIPNTVADPTQTEARPESQRETIRSILNDQKADSETNLDESDPLAWLSWLLCLALCAGALYFLNVGSKGEFGRFIAGIFPVETSALKIKEYLERV